jgi:uncharacterized membrane protein YhhN
MTGEASLTLAYVAGLISWLIAYVALTAWMRRSGRPGSFVWRIALAGGVGVLFGFAIALFAAG